MSAHRLVQVISDVHCDVRGTYLKIEPTAPTLVIAGDVSNHSERKYRDYLEALTSNHRNVAYVPGNHEFYASGIPVWKALDTIERVCNSLSSNVVLLREGGQKGLDIPDTGVRVVGATMWTNLPKPITPILETKLNDFSLIFTDLNETLTGDGMNALHRQDRKWLLESVVNARKEGKKALVVTHHSPDMRLSALCDRRAMNGYGPLYFASDMGQVINQPNIVGWVHGHTHESHVMFLPEVNYPFVTNALGYPGESTGYASGSGLKI